jgi:hypothetical protein
MNRALFQTGMLRPIPNSPTEGGGGDPPAGDPPAGDPPAGDPPAGDPPSGNWFDALPDDLKAEVGVTRHKDMADAIRAGIAAEKRLGVPADQVLRVPTKPEEMDAFAKDVFKRLGAPDAPEGYKIDLGEKPSDADKAMGAKFAKHMFEAGQFPPAAVDAAVKFWMGEVAAAEAADAQATKEAAERSEAALKAEFGQAYEPAVKEIGKLINDLGGKDLADELDANGLAGNSPHLFRFLKALTDKMAEGGPTGDGQRSQTGDRPLTPGEAKWKRAELESDPIKGKALRDGTHPLHKAVVEERNKYLMAENPDLAKA